MKFKVGDRVLVVDRRNAFDGFTGTIREVITPSTFQVGLDYGAVIHLSEASLSFAYEGAMQDYPAATDTEPPCMCPSPSAHESDCLWMIWKDDQRRKAG